MRPGARQVLAARLKELRSQAGMSQEELAGHARVSRAYLSDLERALPEAGIDVLLRLARALSVSPGALLDGALSNPVSRPMPRRRKPRLSPAERLGRQVSRLAEGADDAALRRFAVVAKAFFPKR